MPQYNFENLEIWKLSVHGIKEMDILIKRLPKEEAYALSDQMRRAALSVALNIAEGSGRGSKLDFKRFIRNAIGSTLEVIAGMRIAVEKEYFSGSEISSADCVYEKLYFKLIAMEKYLKK